MGRVPILICCLLPAIGVAAAAQDDPPDAGAHFVVESTAFASGLGEETTQNLEDRVARHLATSLERHFTFLNWVTEGDTGQLPGTRVVFKMIDRELPNLCDPESRLIVRVVRDGGEEIELLDVPEVPLYSACDVDYPNQEEDVVELAERLKGEITALLDNAAFREQLQSKFLQHISLIGKVVLQPGDQRVVLPLRCKDLLPDRDQTLVRVGFKVQGTSNAGEMTLKVSQSDELVTCEIQKFSFAPELEFVSPPSWHEDIVNVLDETRLAELSVYMKDYERDDFVCDEFGDTGALSEPF